MPGRLFLDYDGPSLAADLGLEGAAIAGESARANIAPGQQIVVWSAAGLSLMRWGIVPVGRVNARGRPVMEQLINARSETVFDKSAYAGVGRAVVPAHGWYEWTGEKRRKTPWRLSSKAGRLLFFAAITDVWEAPGGMKVPQVATVTCPPNTDVAPIHHRMGVLLAREAVPLWLEGSVEEVTPLMVPFADGALRIEQNPQVDWDGP